MARDPSAVGRYAAAERAFKIAYWSDALARHGGNISQVARESGLSRTDLYKRLKRLGLFLPRCNGGAHRGKWD